MNRTIIFMHVFAFISCVSSLGAMKPEWPPRIQQEMSKPYVKAGIQEMQQEVAREVWNRPGSDRKNLIDNYVHSIGFQAVIGQMQENLGLTDDLIVARVKEALGRIKTIDETTKDKWMPILNYAYPRLSQLMLAKARIYTDNDFDTLVGIVSIMHETYVKAIAKSKNIELEKPTDAITQQYKLLFEIDNRIGKVGDALGPVLWMKKISAEKLTGFISMKLGAAFDQVLKEYPIKTGFKQLYSSYHQLISDLSFIPKIMGHALPEKMPTLLKNKLKDAVIVAMIRHSALTQELGYLSGEYNKITDPVLREKTKKFIIGNGGYVIEPRD